MSYFYSKLVTIEEIWEELSSLDLSIPERKHLAELLDSSLHHTILDAILSELSDQDKKVFLSNLSENDHSKIWSFLNGKVDNIEEKIKKTAEDLKSELKKDLKEVKRTK